MKLCVIGPTYPFRGGIAHHTTLLVRHLREAGHEVLFLSFTRQYPRFLYGRDDKDPSESPLQTETEYLLDSVNPLTWVRALRRVRVFAPAQVIMPWWVPFWAVLDGFLSWGIKKWVKPAPRLTFMCHNVLPHEESWLDVWAVRLGIGRGDDYVVHAQSEAEKLRSVFGEDTAVVVTPHPTYAELGAEASHLPVKLPDGVPLLLFCGLVRRYKGLDILLEALPLVLAERVVHLAIVGEFWDDVAVYEAQIARLGIGAHVTILNEYVADAVLAGFVRRADAVVLPYRSATQSGVVQLALGHGTAVVTTRVGGLSEAVEDGVTGVLVMPESPVALAEGVLQVLGMGLFDCRERLNTWQSFSVQLMDAVSLV